MSMSVSNTTSPLAWSPPTVQTSTRTNVIDILAGFNAHDFNEELLCDACHIAMRHNDLKLNIVFLDKKPVLQLGTLRHFLGAPNWDVVSSASNVKFYRSHDREPEPDYRYTKLGDETKTFHGSFKDLAKETTDKKQDTMRHYEHYVLQVGIVHGVPQGWIEYIKSMVDATYTCTLLNTILYKKDADNTANELWNSAKRSRIVDDPKRALKEFACSNLNDSNMKTICRRGNLFRRTTRRRENPHELKRSVSC